MVSLQRYGSHYCGGSVVAAGWVLTAAHCTSSPGDIAVVGAHDITDDTDACAERIEIETVYTHKLYDPVTTDYDIALVKLATPTAYEPIALGLEGMEDLTADGALATVAGWGVLQQGALDVSSTLQKVSLPIVGNEACMEMYGVEGAGEYVRMLCAGYAEEGGKDSCQGDSGGPLFSTQNGSPVQIGIVSFGNGCAQPGYPGVYARVSELSSFINSVLSGTNDESIVTVIDEPISFDFDSNFDFGSFDFDFGDGSFEWEVPSFENGGDWWTVGADGWGGSDWDWNWDASIIDGELPTFDGGGGSADGGSTDSDWWADGGDWEVPSFGWDWGASDIDVDIPTFSDDEAADAASSTLAELDAALDAELAELDAELDALWQSFNARMWGR